MRQPVGHVDEDRLDQTAVREVRGGNIEAFASIVSRYTARVFALAVRTIGSREDAEEATQEVFLRAYRALGSFNPEHRFFSWLYTIAVNHIRSLHRRRSRSVVEQTVPLGEHIVADRPAGTDSQPEQHVLSEGASRLIAAALQSLGPRYREVFVLRHLRGLSTAEVSALLGVGENTVKTRLRRARSALQDYLTAAGIGEGDQ